MERDAGTAAHPERVRHDAMNARALGLNHSATLAYAATGRAVARS